MEEVVGGPGRGRSEAVVVLGTSVATGRGGRRRWQRGEEGGDGKRRTAAAATGRGGRRRRRRRRRGEGDGARRTACGRVCERGKRPGGDGIELDRAQLCTLTTAGEHGRRFASGT